MYFYKRHNTPVFILNYTLECIYIQFKRNEKKLKLKHFLNHIHEVLFMINVFLIF